MTLRAQQTSNDYGIVVEPLAGEVIAWRGKEIIARSNRAKVMYETRLSPVVYFPQEDILAELEPAPEHKTFCPFKGTASYSHVKVGEERMENGAWHYPKALPEGQAVDGCFAFMPGVADRIEHEGAEIEALPIGNITGPVVDWLLREAWLAKSPDELLAALGRKLVEDGVAVSRLSILIWSLHPMIAGQNCIWSRDEDEVISRYPSYEILESPVFTDSPFQHVADGLGGVRQKLDTNPDEFNFPIMEDLKEKGVTDYVAMPLPFSDGRINVLTLASDHPNGFTTANLGLIFECSALISRLFEVFALTSSATSLLETYLGKRTGARVLGGEIRRGDGDVIDAAILFCDLRHSTRLETELGREAYVEQLNRFFEVTTDIVNSHEGEVLKFIGDAVLAIFPAGAGHAAACAHAVESAHEIVSRLKDPDPETNDMSLSCAIGIAYGEVTYGNVGSKERLDFTVIGSAANVAARLGEYGKVIGQPVVATDEVAVEGRFRTDSLGGVELHNVRDRVAASTVFVEG
ncbi:guanylate cyclase [Labrenzia sp. VG12]|nr:guanylate cyclase [Labrenzia sp. VG12]